MTETTAIPSDLLGEIINDPEGDASGSIDITSVRAGADPAEITMEIDLADSSPMSEATGFVFLDTGQDPSTGLPFDVRVEDGTLDIEFVAQRGDKAIINAVLVTHRADLSAE